MRTSGQVLGCDTSFLISVFLDDSNHIRARDLLLSVEEPIILSRLNLLEFQTSIRRMIGSRLLEEATGLRVIEEFGMMLEAGAFTEINPPEDGVWERAKKLTILHSAEFQLRSLDVWQIAFALEMGASRLWSFDDRQRKLAAAVGLELNP